MGDRRRSWTWAALLLTPLSSGCFEPSDEAKARLEQIKVEGKAFDAQLDAVEDRLLGNQTRVSLWQELGQRHQDVSALACANVVKHADEMVVLREKQAEKVRHHRGQLASDEPLAGAGVGGPLTVVPASEN